MSRVAFINAVGGTMYVDESRVDEYKGAGFMLASDVIDTTAVIVDAEEKPKPTRSKKKKEV